MYYFYAYIFGIYMYLYCVTCTCGYLNSGIYSAEFLRLFYQAILFYLNLFLMTQIGVPSFHFHKYLYFQFRCFFQPCVFSFKKNYVGLLLVGDEVHRKAVFVHLKLIINQLL